VDGVTMALVDGDADVVVAATVGAEENPPNEKPTGAVKPTATPPLDDDDVGGNGNLNGVAAVVIFVCLATLESASSLAASLAAASANNVGRVLTPLTDVNTFNLNCTRDCGATPNLFTTPYNDTIDSTLLIISCTSTIPLHTDDDNGPTGRRRTILVGGAILLIGGSL
jgi:hypothetical protein